jgi:hypothetical protein
MTQKESTNTLNPTLIKTRRKLSMTLSSMKWEEWKVKVKEEMSKYRH